MKIVTFHFDEGSCYHIRWTWLKRWKGITMDFGKWVIFIIFQSEN